MSSEIDLTRFAPEQMDAQGNVFSYRDKVTGEIIPTALMGNNAGANSAPPLRLMPDPSQTGGALGQISVAEAMELSKQTGVPVEDIIRRISSETGGPLGQVPVGQSQTGGALGQVPVGQSQTGGALGQVPVGQSRSSDALKRLNLLLQI